MPMRFINNIAFSFPVQLLLMHFKRHHLLLLFWGLLFLMISGAAGSNFGIHFLLLDPEYLGHVDFVSFSILGAAIGGFIMTWNITTYILESYRFSFMAAFERPFAVYCLNNALLPLTFVTTYVLVLVNFQSKSELVSTLNILIDLAGLLGGMFSVIFLAAVYFQTTNKNVFNLFKNELSRTRFLSKRVYLQEDKNWRIIQQTQSEFRVDVYLTFGFKMRYTRSVKHYDDKMLQGVFRQNHFNAFMIELVSILIILGLGFLIDHRTFRIPAAASGVLFFSVMVALSGMVDFWLKSWKAFFLLLAIFVINIIMIKFSSISYKNKAYGLNYDCTPAEYSYSNLARIASPKNIKRDELNTIAILNAWKAHTGEKKPKLVLMNFSGGGLGAAMFSTAVIQKADSILKGNLLKHTMLMTGASGGMIGASYIRELYLGKMEKKIYSLNGQKYLSNISKDLLNSIVFTWATNDFFYPWQTFKIGNNVYNKDRGYIFERQLNENTGYLMSRPISTYDQYEKAGIIPMIVYAPTIINDQRRLYICSQPVSYLMRPLDAMYKNDTTDIDGVDFGALFDQQDAGNLRLTSAIRMSATYPYILPYVTMPSRPMMKVMDAGLRDNYGLTTTARFIRAFKDWINENTSGVVIIQVRQYTKKRDIEDYKTETMLDGILTPVTNLYGNLTSVQDYDQCERLSNVYEYLEGKVELINFEYTPLKKKHETSLSFHLTTSEKNDIIQTVSQPNIEIGVERLKYLLKRNY